MEEKGTKPDLIFLNALINVFAEPGNMVEEAIEKMEESGFRPNISTYNTLTKGYGKAGKPKESMKLLDQMMMMMDV